MDHLAIHNLYDVSGKVALVTGGGTGIGLMMASALATNGAKVYIGSRRGVVIQWTANDLTAKVGRRVIPIVLDVTDKESIKNAVKEISEEEGKLDILVNNAAAAGPVSAFFNNDFAPESRNPETLGNALFDTQSFQCSIFFVTSAFLGLLSKASEKHGAWSACVINIGDMSGQLKISQNRFCYNASKGATNHLTKMLATEYALKNIPVRVNCIAPGVFPSEMTGQEGDFPLTGAEASDIAQGIGEIPIARSGTDTDMAGATLFLSSPASYYMTGQILTIDGGFVATQPSVA
ncbi:Enoyl-(Acyl carrier protein) reductase [Ceratobasidium sp. AG-Ba]|nr:Enoyl-(Acyl carrier protein) reductase [Ceratobasidium sp. AG-Ba]QRW03595.1 Enoyl-(Acyl carrier protein) reductase [Ceratobasidium sp. AG-Ba]